MNIPPKLTPEQIDDIDQGMCGERECVQPFAQGVADARDQQWLDMLSAAPGVERIMELAREFAERSRRCQWAETVKAGAALRTAVEQALKSEGVAAHLNGYREAEQALAARVPVITSAQEDAILETGLVNVPFGMTAADAARKVAEVMLAAAPQPPQRPTDPFAFTEREKRSIVEEHTWGPDALAERGQVLRVLATVETILRKKFGGTPS